MTYLTSDFVGVAWLRSLSQFFGVDVANEPIDPWIETTDEFGNTFWKPTWTGRDFISIVVVGDGGDPDEDDFVPIYQIDCWSRPKNRGSQPPWYAANQLAEMVRHLPHEMETSLLVNLPQPYSNVRVSQVWTMSGPRRVPNDPNGLAHYTLDVAVVFNPEEVSV